MNPGAILSLMSNLYEQLVAAQDRIRELERQLADKPLAAMRGDKSAAERPDAKVEDSIPTAQHDPVQEADASKTKDASTGAGEPKPTGETDVTKLWPSPRRKASAKKK